MSKIDTMTAIRFRAGQPYNNTNTQVTVSDNGESRLFLWGNLIAWTSDDRSKLNINQCGWDTATTNSRLRALGVNICHKRTRLYINGQPADSTTTYTMAY